MKKSLFSMFGLMIISACTTLQPAPTPTSIPPTVPPPPTSCEVVEGICLELTFDGESCTYEGPTNLKPGPVTLIFHNESDGWAETNLMRFLEDKTLQDVLDYFDFGEKPSQQHAPSWSFSYPGVYVHIEAGESHFWEGALDSGIHSLVCVGNGVWPEPIGVWLGNNWTIED